MRISFYLLNEVLQIVIPLAIQLRDMRRMSEREREQVWPFSTWGAALLYFGPLSLVAWGYVTRLPRYWSGLLHGAFLAEIALVAQALVCEVVGRAMALAPKTLHKVRMNNGKAIVGALALAVVVGAARSVYELYRRRSGKGRALR